MGFKLLVIHYNLPVTPGNKVSVTKNYPKFLRMPHSITVKKLKIPVLVCGSPVVTGL